MTTRRTSRRDGPSSRSGCCRPRSTRACPSRPATRSRCRPRTSPTALRQVVPGGELRRRPSHPHRRAAGGGGRWPAAGRHRLVPALGARSARARRCSPRVSTSWCRVAALSELSRVLPGADAVDASARRARRVVRGRLDPAHHPPDRGRVPELSGPDPVELPEPAHGRPRGAARSGASGEAHGARGDAGAAGHAHRRPRARGDHPGRRPGPRGARRQVRRHRAHGRVQPRVPARRHRGRHRATSRRRRRSTR